MDANTKEIGNKDFFRGIPRGNEGIGLVAGAGFEPATSGL
jgi:hypothetical protein